MRLRAQQRPTTPHPCAHTHGHRDSVRVIVVGGGVAGIAAAIRLAEEGARVTLIETRKKLGGRATSFTDVRTGESLDNCQHVVMGCCTNYLDLCARLGVLDKIEFTRDVLWLEKGGRRTILKPGILPAPAHMAGSFLLARFLDTTEKLAIARAMSALVRAQRDGWRGRVFSEWLTEQDQPPGAIRKFWAPVVVSACNVDIERVDACVALHVFQEGFLAHRDAPAIGISRVPLVELYDRAEHVLRAAGGEILLGTSVACAGERSVQLSSGETLEADRVICAAPPERTAKIIDPSLHARDGRFKRFARVQHSPILGVHITFDRPVFEPIHASLVHCATQWLFRKDDEGARVHAVISGADEWMGLGEEEIGVRILEDIRACIPEARHAGVVRVRAVKEKRATYAPTPEMESIRPTTTGASEVILAGDFVRTGWPGTMEGAARSGYLAAAAALGRSERWALRSPLPMSAMCRVAGMPAFG